MRAGPRIAVTEHFPLFGAGDGDQIRSILDQSRTLAAALYTASLLQSFIREDVFMANYNIAVSKWFGALITDSDSGLILDADLPRVRSVQEPLRVDGGTESSRRTALRHRGPGIGLQLSGVDYLDVLATQDRDGFSTSPSSIDT